MLAGQLAKIFSRDDACPQVIQLFTSRLFLRSAHFCYPYDLSHFHVRRIEWKAVGGDLGVELSYFSRRDGYVLGNAQLHFAAKKLLANLVAKLHLDVGHRLAIDPLQLLW